MTVRYKRGDQWYAADANFVLETARQFVGTPLPVLHTPTAGNPIFLAVMDSDIEFGSTPANATKWDETVTPPTDLGETVEVYHDWFRDNPQTISAGQRVAYIKQGDVNRIYFAECEPAEETQIGG